MNLTEAFASIHALLEKWGTLPSSIKEVLGAGALFGTAIALHFLFKPLILKGIKKITESTETQWDNIFYQQRVFHPLIYIGFLLVIYTGAGLFFDNAVVLKVLKKLSFVCLGGCFLLVINRGLLAFNQIYKGWAISKTKPITGYIQLGQMLLTIIFLIIGVSALIGKSPLGILSGLGAFTAVLLLVFRETIISVAASFQIQISDIVHVGDWIEMPAYGIDGEVLEIALHITKIQNWDKTIVSIPTHKFINDSLKNWRGMAESGGRRIKRAILIDQDSICFASEEDITKWQKIELLRPYLKKKADELRLHNEKRDLSILGNGRRLTNIGTFRAYIKAYIKEHPKLHRGMTTLIRQLHPTSQKGLPLEIYVFTNTTDWIHYEEIQSDLFDHLLAVLADFGLKTFQRSSSAKGEP